MPLVHAACDDVSSMIFQEVKVYLFDRNMMRSTGRAISKATRDAQDRSKQITVANDFIEAFSDPAAMLEQIRETLHPKKSRLGKHYIPHSTNQKEGHLLKTCQGCGKAITKEQMYPLHMVFK